MFKIKTFSLNLLSIIFLVSSSNLTLSSDSSPNSSSSSSSSSGSSNNLQPNDPDKGKERDPSSQHSNANPSTQNLPDEKTTFSTFDLQALRFYDCICPNTANDADGNPINYKEQTLPSDQDGSSSGQEDGWFKPGLDKRTTEMISGVAKTGLRIGFKKRTYETLNKCSENGLKTTFSLNKETRKTIDNMTKEGLKTNVTFGLDERNLASLDSMTYNICILFASIACTTIGSTLIYKNSKIEKLKSSKTALLATGVSLIACGIAIPCLFLKGSTPPAA